LIATETNEVISNESDKKGIKEKMSIDILLVLFKISSATSLLISISPQNFLIQ
jgi:hypothetical protein